MQLQHFANYINTTFYVEVDTPNLLARVLLGSCPFDEDPYWVFRTHHVEEFGLMIFYIAMFKVAFVEFDMCMIQIPPWSARLSIPHPLPQKDRFFRSQEMRKLYFELRQRIKQTI